jgi:DNA modification methylase
VLVIMLGVVLVAVPGALVVNPFCGSGKLPAACKRLGRQWLA